MNYASKELSGSEDGSHIFEVFDPIFFYIDVHAHYTFINIKKTSRSIRTIFFEGYWVLSFVLTVVLTFAGNWFINWDGRCTARKTV